MIKAITRENFFRNIPAKDKINVRTKNTVAQVELPQLNKKYAGDFTNDKWTEFL